MHVKSLVKGCLGLLSVFVAIRVNATNVYKADNADALELTSSWTGGAVPGENDVAVFDGLSETNFWVGAPITWGGVLFTNMDAVVRGTVKIALSPGAAENASLTLGAEGMKCSTTNVSLVLGVPISLSAPQVWALNQQKQLVLRNVIADNGNGLTINGNKGSGLVAFWSTNAVSGTLSIEDVKQVYVYADRDVARSFRAVGSSGSPLVDVVFATTAGLRDLFPSGSFTVTNGVCHVDNAAIHFDAGDDVVFLGADTDTRLDVIRGSIVQNGGALVGSSVRVQYGPDNGQYQMNSGSLSLDRALLVGTFASGTRTALFTQNGGMFTTPLLHLGCYSPSHETVARYEMNDGELFVKRTVAGAKSGLYLSTANENLIQVAFGRNSSGFFTMTGGVVEADGIGFGSDTSALNQAATNAYSVFKLSGGTFLLGDGGFRVRKSFNNGIPNAGYAVKLGGGTLRAREGWVAQTDILLDKRSDGIVVDTEDGDGVGHDVAWSGLVYGGGGLEKTGQGRLVLAASVATGPVTVREGELILGETATYRWTADSLTLDDGAAVTAWNDVCYGVPAVQGTYAAPSLKKNVVNGHSVVRFNGASKTTLTVSAADSPVAGCSSFTVAFVMRADTVGYTTGTQLLWYRHTGIFDCEVGGIQNDWGISYTAKAQISAGAGYQASSKEQMIYSDAAYSLADGQPHVVIFSLDGTNLSLNVDGRVATAVAIGSAPAARGAYPFNLGCVNYAADRYFTGDLAEFRIYRDLALDENAQNRLGAELAARYGATNTLFTVSPAGGVPVSDAALSAYSNIVWSAETLVGESGSRVEAWTATDGAHVIDRSEVSKDLDGSYADAQATTTAPTLMRCGMGLKPVVRFNAAETNVLAVRAADNPFGGNTNFSLALVFQTTTPGYTVDRNWYRNTGLLDMECAWSVNDWGLSFSTNGQICAGIGNPDQTLHSLPYDLNDGAPHVVVAVWDVANSNLVVMVDGLPTTYQMSEHLNPRLSRRVLVGSVNIADGRYFTGDLAEMQFYPECALSSDDRAELTRRLASKYGVTLIPKLARLAWTDGSLTASRYRIENGAVLALPSPSTLRNGSAVSGDGSVNGSLLVAAGGVVDGREGALAVETLCLEDGAELKFANDVNGLNALSVGDLSISGTVNVSIDNGRTLSGRNVLATFDFCDIAADTEWQIEGTSGAVRIRADQTQKTLVLIVTSGTLISVR